MAFIKPTVFNKSEEIKSIILQLGTHNLEKSHFPKFSYSEKTWSVKCEH